MSVRVMNPQCVPFLQVTDASVSSSFYCEVLGFQKEWEYQPDADAPAFVSVRRENIRLFLTEHPESSVGALLYCYVEDVDRFCQEIAERGAVLEWEPVDTDWNTRELQLRDPDGNKLRFGSVRS
jgi:uncharacterized glyoxalase superfamily protein PhnB